MYSVVVPVYNEEEALPYLHGEITPVMQGIGAPYEIVYVDDGSSDRSRAVIKELQAADAAVRLVGFKENAGQSAAMTAGCRAAVDLRVLMGTRLRVQGTVLRSRSTEEKAAVTLSFREQVLPLFEFGAVRPVVDRVFGFDEVPAAHRYMESNVSFGKIVVQV